MTGSPDPSVTSPESVTATEASIAKMVVENENMLSIMTSITCFTFSLIHLVLIC
jgi:hypothetical protein